MAMSTTEALRIAVSALHDQPDTPKRNEAIRLLNSLTERGTNNFWSKETILNTLENWINENKKLPSYSDLRLNGLPCPQVIYKHFGKKASDVIKEYFCSSNNICMSNFSKYKTSSDWIDCFVEQFYKHDRPNSRRYDMAKDEGTPNWFTIAKHCGVSNWSSLLKLAHVSSNEHSGRKTVQDSQIYIKSSSSKLLEKYEDALNKKERLNKEFFDAIDRNIKS